MYASTGTRGSESCASAQSQNAFSAGTSVGAKYRISGTFSTRSRTTLRVTSSQCGACSSTS